MSLMLNFQLMADYNQWMNDKIYETVASLTAEDLSEDRGAFFGSILGTLNHILVGILFGLNVLHNIQVNFLR